MLFALPGREDAGAGPEAGDFAAGFASPAAADPAGEAVLAAWPRAGASELCVVSAAGAGGHAPLAWARALEQVAAGGGAAAVIAAATDHGSEVLAHLGALTGLPVAANCVAVAPDEPGHWRLTRQRWACSPLEDAVLDASCALLTLAADAIAAARDSGDAGGAGGAAVGTAGGGADGAASVGALAQPVVPGSGGRRQCRRGCGAVLGAVAAGTPV